MRRGQAWPQAASNLVLGRSSEVVTVVVVVISVLYLTFFQMMRIVMLFLLKGNYNKVKVMMMMKV